MLDESLFLFFSFLMVYDMSKRIKYYLINKPRASGGLAPQGALTGLLRFLEEGKGKTEKEEKQGEKKRKRGKMERKKG